MQEIWIRSLGWEDSLEKEMATHSHILAGKIPWMEGHGRLQSMGVSESDMTEWLHFHLDHLWGLPWWLLGKECTCNAGDTRDTVSILESGRSPGEGNGTPLQFSCLENPMAEEPGGLQSRGHKRVGQDLATKQQQTARLPFAAQKSYHVDTQRTFLLFVFTAFHYSITSDFLLF